MHISFEYILLIFGTILFLAIFSSKTSSRYGIPILLLFLGIGMFAGSDGLGKIYFDNAGLAQSLGVIALIFILFAGGLDTDYANVKPFLRQGISLSTLGVALTGLLSGLFCWYVLGFSIWEALLLGSIISSTDAAAVFSILRAKNMSLKSDLKSILELESGSNDPMAVFLVMSFIYILLHPAQSHFWSFVIGFVSQMGIGFIMGVLAGRQAVRIINRIKLDYEALYPALTIAFIFLVYAVTILCRGNGFLAVYIMGLTMNRFKFIARRNIRKFYDVASWLMQIIMFVTLGLLVFPSRLPAVMKEGVLLTMFLIFVARPVSVFISLALAKNSIKEKLLLSWVGLRGAAPIILATFPFVAGIPRAETMFNIVFFVVIISVLLQGSTVMGLARFLKLEAPYRKKLRIPIEMEEVDGLDKVLFEVQVPLRSKVIKKMIMEIGLPENALIVMINRKGKYLTPKGNTLLRKEDKLLFLVEKTDKEKIRQIILHKA